MGRKSEDVVGITVEDHGNTICIAIVDAEGVGIDTGISIDEAKKVLSKLSTTLKVAEDVRIEHKRQLIQKTEQKLQALRYELRVLEDSACRDS